MAADVEVPDELQRAASLTDYAVTLRYPGDFEPITEEEYQQAIQLAEQFLTWASNQIKLTSGPMKA